MIRGTKDRPPQRGSLKRGVTAGIEKSLTNREEGPNEDRQEEHISADMMEVESWIHEPSGLPPAPAEGKMCGFHTGQDSDDQPSTS